ncbi:hypothetical protein Trydic_g20967 [Trypoxylus dichotomus]
MWMLTVTMLNRGQSADIGSNALKAMISMSTTKDALIAQESFKRKNLRSCLQHWMLTHLQLKNAYMCWKWFRRQGIGLAWVKLGEAR